MQLKISYIIPCYNVVTYLEKCFYSILAQSFLECEFEVIFIDDGSSDGTKELIRKICEKYTFVKTYFYDTPSGYAGRPRNKGIELARGQYISFIDPDDYFVANTVKEALMKNLGYDIIINSFHIINPSGKLLDSIKLKNKEINRNKMLWAQIMNVCNQRSLYRREFITKANIKFEEHIRSQDLIFLYTCYINKAKIKTTNQFTTFYLDERVDSVSNVISERFINSSIEMLEILYNLIKEQLPAKEVKSIMQEHFIAVYLKAGKSLRLRHKNMIKKQEFYKYLQGKGDI